VGGLFTLPDSTQAYKQVFFFAAGIGITPVISLLKTLLHRDEQVQAVLIYSNHSKEDVVFYNEIQTLAARFGDRFKQELLFSNSFNLMRARLSKALLPVIMKEYTTVPKEEVLCYVCGPFPYMRMVIWSLEEWGIKDAHIRKENFNTNDRAVARTEPPDKEPHVVALLHNRQQYSFTVQYPDTILQAAKRQGINLPYSCETGRCGSCAALCTSGKVWLSYNEVLMDSDIKQGAILTCTGYPEGGDVTIEA
jgi:ferredoxin-NADP reductase